MNFFGRDTDRKMSTEKEGLKSADAMVPAFYLTNQNPSLCETPFVHQGWTRCIFPKKKKDGHRRAEEFLAIEGKSLRLRRRQSPFILTFLMTGSLVPDSQKLYIFRRFRSLCRLVSANLDAERRSASCSML